MYKIIGADGHEYGPVDAATLRQWVSEGRVNAQTRILPTGATQWLTFAQIPELASSAAPLAQLVSYSGMAPRTNPLALIGMILGILALPFGICCFCCYGLPFSIPGIIFSTIGLIQIRNNPQTYNGSAFAIAGLILSILSLITFILFFGLGLVVAAADIAGELEKS